MSTNFEDLIGRGATGSKPAAGVPGRLYYDTTLERWERDTGLAWEVCEPAAGAVDAADVTYTPTTAADWDSDADPGDLDSALDQLAERVDDLEAVSGGAMVLIEKKTAGAGGVASFDFTSIPATYGTLVLHGRFLSEVAATYEPIYMRFNNDSGNNYDRQLMQGYGTTSSISAAHAKAFFDPVGAMPGSTSTAGTFSQGTIEIVEYANTNFWKTVFSRFVMMLTTTEGEMRVQHIVGNWRSTAAINRITLYGPSGDFAEGSVVSLYGIAH